MPVSKKRRRAKSNPRSPKGSSTRVTLPDRRAMEDCRRHHRSPALATKPAGQDPRKANGLHRCRNSDALFAPECQSFLDNVVAHLRAGRSWSDPCMRLTLLSARAPSGVCWFGRLESRAMIYKQADVERRELSPGSVLVASGPHAQLCGPPAAMIDQARMTQREEDRCRYRKSDGRQNPIRRPRKAHPRA